MTVLVYYLATFCSLGATDSAFKHHTSSSNYILVTGYLGCTNS